MGQFFLQGDTVASWADTLTTNNVGTMKPMQARYNLFCNEAGGTHDDTIFYRLENRWMLVVNAGNADKMWRHLQAHAPHRGVEMENWHGKRALIAIQGPQSVAMLQFHVDLDLDSLKYYFCAEGTVDGLPATIARTGYTGEDGFELFLNGKDAPHIWSLLLEEHSREGLEPCGLGARDVLRLEAGMPLYGHELTETITPVLARRRRDHGGTRAGARRIRRLARGRAQRHRVQRFDRTLSGKQERRDRVGCPRGCGDWDAVGGRDSRREASGDGGAAAVLQTSAVRKERNVGAARGTAFQ
jgi:glycine cleavage system aminomethyltransferase T